MILTKIQIYNIVEGIAAIQKNTHLPFEVGYILLSNKDILLPYYLDISKHIKEIVDSSLSPEEKQSQADALAAQELEVQITSIPFDKIKDVILPIEVIEKLLPIVWSK